MKMTNKELAEFRKSLTESLNGKREKDIRKSAGDVETKVEITKENYSFSKYLRGATLGIWDNAETEKGMFKKAMEQSVGTAGGFLVPTQTSSQIIENLKETAVMRQMPGVRTIAMDTDKMVINRIDTPVDVSWGGENQQITENTNMTFGEVSLELKKMVCLQKISRELLMNANPSIDNLVIQDMTEEIALEEDRVILEGTGGSQPRGLYYHPYVLNTDLSGTIDYDNVLDAMYQVRLQQDEVNGWVSHPRTENTLRKLKDADGNYIYREGRVTDGSNAKVSMLYGAPVRYTTKLPITNRPSANESYLVGGNWSNLLIGEKPTLRIETTDSGGDAFTYDQVWIKVVRYIDVALRHPESFVVVKGIQA